ncbi:hypothetical protein COCVIDRAFT_110228 [Bipolaris victoriae FI3]|uniref:Uncharacterized protein n=1 Tax=Bipolaris victoriae (strain FI3) TaxID=930091 RepID=W7E756_BIPV3|nr:hypothetical protein COCVIDRAFT_110228 [Bipolaris victoriae FI3]
MHPPPYPRIASYNISRVFYLLSHMYKIPTFFFFQFVVIVVFTTTIILWCCFRTNIALHLHATQTLLD